MSGFAGRVTPSSGQFNYPTRNFATLGIVVTSHPKDGRPGHFCRAPHVAMRIGLSHHRFLIAAPWRTVSEDPFQDVHDRSSSSA